MCFDKCFNFGFFINNFVLRTERKIKEAKDFDIHNISQKTVIRREFIRVNLR